MKRIISIFMVVLMLFSVLSVTVCATDYYKFYEEEPNDYLYLSDRIYNNCSITASISDYDDLDCFEFVLPYRTTVYVSCCSDVSSILLGILDSNGEIVTVAQGEYDRDRQVYFDSVAITLEQGTYYISMVADYDFVYTNALYVVVFDYEIKTNQHTHSYTASKVNSTCTETGYTTYTCSCGDSYTEETPAKHSPISVIKGTPATYSSTGLSDGSVCLTCGKKIVEQAIVPMLKLNKVSGLKSTSSTTTSVKLKWSEVEGAEGYEVSYKKGDSWISKIVTTNKTTISSLGSGKTYSFKVKAINGSNEGEESKTLKASTKPSKVSIKKVKSSKKKIIDVSWKSVKGATHYEIQYSTSSKFNKAKKTTAKKTTKKTIKKLKSGKKYYVRVRAYRVVNDKKVYGAWSSSKSIKIK